MDEPAARRGETSQPDRLPAVRRQAEHRPPEQGPGEHGSLDHPHGRLPRETPGDPFPRHRVRTLGRHLPAYAKLALRLAKDGQLSRARRAAVVAAAAYLVSPIDAIPGIIPVLGQLDDLLLGMAAIRFALAGLRPEERARHLAAVGLSDAALGEDLRHAGAVGAWMGRSGVRLGARGARAAVQAGTTGAGAALRGGSRLVRGGARAVMERRHGLRRRDLPDRSPGDETDHSS